MQLRRPTILVIMCRVQARFCIHVGPIICSAPRGSTELASQRAQSRTHTIPISNTIAMRTFHIADRANIDQLGLVLSIQKPPHISSEQFHMKQRPYILGELGLYRQG